MLNTFRKWLDNKAENGINFFYANDKTTGKASITLFFAYTSYILACISLVALHFKEQLLTATSMAFIFSGMMIVFYLLRQLSKASFSLKDKSISLENEEKDKE